ncbi:hypothetical protein GCWU000341_02536 [Oribacterium sp. oral taxon 078 str. F0262]|nr:hypothetical protein GCWU000341_02536 [Oribacterium sp. oral taxon 078 str. F0262]
MKELGFAEGRSKDLENQRSNHTQTLNIRNGESRLCLEAEECGRTEERFRKHRKCSEENSQ